MRGTKFLSFLIISLILTAFLAGYIMVNRGLGSGSKSKTGTILDKFGEQQPTDSKEQVPEGNGIFPISSVKVVSVSNSSDRKGTIYFEKNTGKLFEFDFSSNQEQVISDTVLPNFLSSIWSPVKKEALNLFYSPGNTKITYHNYDTGKTNDLNNNIRSVAFSPDGNMIAYYLTNTIDSDESYPPTNEMAPVTSQINKLYISQPDGTYPKKILDTRITDLEISWPIKDQLSFITPDREVFLLTESGRLTKFLEPRTNLTTKWSVGGKKLLFSWGEDITNQQLWLKDTESKSEKNLTLSIIASRCAWSIDNINIFCAVAKTPSIDDIYRINTNTGSQELLVEPAMPLEDIFLTAVEDYLIFKNAADEKLYGVKLLP